jgi:rubrerythrin
MNNKLLFIVLINSFIFIAVIILPDTIYSAGDGTPSSNPTMRSALQTAYYLETLRAQTYSAFSKKADSEYYPNIARLFSAFAFSESIHADNFKKLMARLGIDKTEKPTSEIIIADTKSNLKNAADAELEDIDTNYPCFIAAAKSEGQQEVLKYFIYALKSEEQHRKLLLKIQSKAGMFFPMLAKKIEDKPCKYFVCTLCGATDTRIPEPACPVCNEPSAAYKETAYRAQVTYTERK